MIYVINLKLGSIDSFATKEEASELVSHFVSDECPLNKIKVIDGTRLYINTKIDYEEIK